MARFASQPGNGDGTRFGHDGEADLEAQPATRRLGSGSIIEGKYRLEHLLGEGGMGAVWRAHNLQLDLPVAIKLLRAGSDSATLAERLKLEARAVARLSHPAIVRVFDADTTESGEPFIVMELLEGESLSDLLDRGRLSGVVAVQTLLPIAEGLALAHAKGIVHRDLKPQNVFITQVEQHVQPKLLDFGIAKLTTSALPTGSLTDTGVVVGSPDYMSPEQARGKSDVDYRADIWQFCVVLYESISGNTPFEGENYNALMRAIVEDEPAPLPLDETVDQRLSDLVAWGLTKDRSRRPASIQELGRALAEWLLARGISEDITFAPLGQKWIARPTQKSLPLSQSEATPELQAPTPVRTDTLLSPRFPASVDARGTGLLPTSSGRWRTRALGRLAAIAALLLLGYGLVWMFVRRTAEPRADLQPASRGRAPVVAPPAAAVPALPSAIELAPTAPEPSSKSSGARSVNSASVVAEPVRSSKSVTPKPAPPAAAPSHTATPARDGHDETRELLQAY